MIPTPYFLYARLTPAIICSVPFFVLYFFFLNPRLGPFLEILIKAQWIGDITLLMAFTLLLVLLGRSISKDIFERFWFWSDETRMPTTEFLLHTGTEYTPNFKASIHARIKSDFGIEILSAEAEADNKETARRVIAEAVSLIRQKVKDGRLVLQHNKEYGFFRNLIGCSIIAVATSVLNIWIFYSVAPDKTALWISILMGTAYLMPVLLSKIIMRVHGKRYARVLFQEYLS